MSIMANADVVELRHVGMRYKSRLSFFRYEVFTALNDLTFTIKRGETLGVVGVNGCGKSTLLRVLANIYSADFGTISWNCRQVSLLSLSLGFDPELSGIDNAILSGMLLGGRKADVLKKLDAIVAFSELDKFIEKPIKTYSSGMRSRLGFSVALSMQSELLLIDEVMSVGDGKFRLKAEAAMMDKINSNQTVVLVSHALDQVEKLCSRVLWLDAGKTRMIGATSKVLKAYNSYLLEDQGKVQ